MPRRRKGVKYAPLIPVLLRDAEPTSTEIQNDPDACKRCRVAKGELFKMYRDAEKRGTVASLDIAVRMFCEQEKARNGGVLPKSPGGRPSKEHDRLLVAIKVLETIAALGKQPGRVENALRETADWFGLSYAQVRDIHYDRDPKWQREVKIEMAWRQIPRGKIFPQL